jgi:hypothetical protein
MTSLGNISSGGRCFYLMLKNVFYALVAESNSFVFQEVTKGSVNRKNMDCGYWALSESEALPLGNCLHSFEPYASAYCG